MWASYVLQTPELKLFLGGDRGYGPQFAEIGKRFGPFDLAILEQGQYDKSWNQIHMMPDQVFKAADELRTKRILPVHNSKFTLANHLWKEPLNMITSNHKDSVMKVLTPEIGQPVFLKDTVQTFKKWWLGMK